MGNRCPATPQKSRESVGISCHGWAWPSSALLGVQPDKRPPLIDSGLPYEYCEIRNRPICYGLTFARQDGSSSFPSFFLFPLFFFPSILSSSLIVYIFAFSVALFRLALAFSLFLSFPPFSFLPLYSSLVASPVRDGPSSSRLFSSIELRVPLGFFYGCLASTVCSRIQHQGALE